MARRPTVFLLGAALLQSLSFASPLERRADDSPFHLYAFGENIGGLEVYTAKGLAWIGDPTKPSGMDLSSVSFTVSTSADYTWLAHPNTSTANEVLYLNSSGPEVGLTSSNDTQGKLTSIWWTYGGYVMTKVHNASFYAEPIFDTPGWYSLGWSAEDGGTDKVLVTLRTAKPSTYAVLGQPTL